MQLFEFVASWCFHYTACADFPNVVAQRHILGVRTQGGYDPQIRTRPRLLYNAPTPSVIILCLLVQKLSCWQTNKQTDATENIHIAVLRRWVLLCMQLFEFVASWCFSLTCCRLPQCRTTLAKRECRHAGTQLFCSNERCWADADAAHAILRRIHHGRSGAFCRRCG